MDILFSDSIRCALLAKIIQIYNDNKETGKPTGYLSRTVLQKLCYFAVSKGVPLGYDFEIYHFGPFDKTIYFDVESLIADEVIMDASPQEKYSYYIPGPNVAALINRYAKEISKFEGDIREIVTMFDELGPYEMEIVATVHYVYKSRTGLGARGASDESIISDVYKLKGHKFKKEVVEKTLSIIKRTRLVGWAN